MMDFRQILPSLMTGLGLLLGTMLLSSCDQAAPYLKTVKEILDRDPEESGDVPVKIDPADIPPPPEPVLMAPVVNKEARVTVLGYHDFTEGKSTNDMILNVDDLRNQMQAIQDAKLPVISMREFLDWKKGKKNIPERSVLITIDDGWLATHTLALPVFKEFGYPFTVFLYKNYVNVGGRSMNTEQIREIAQNGGTLSSHSLSHENLSRRGGRTQEAYEAWLRAELEESYQFLVEEFGDTGSVIKTFAFPYGIYNDHVLRLARELGYEACFTVNGKKTTWDTEDMEIGRYVVHGTTQANFDAAIQFGGGDMSSSGRRLMSETTGEGGNTQAPLVTVEPPDQSTIGNRLPLIQADLSKLEGVVPASIALHVSGYGKVPHTYDSETGLVSYQVPQRLRTDICRVQLNFRHAGNSDLERMAWNFHIDLLENYLSTNATRPGLSEVLKRADTTAEPAVAAPPASVVDDSVDLEDTPNDPSATEEEKEETAAPTDDGEA